MTTILLTIGLVAVIMGGMAVGVMLSNKPLQGSCGGIGPDCACDEAGIPRRCEKPPGPALVGLDLNRR